MSDDEDSGVRRAPRYVKDEPRSSSSRRTSKHASNGSKEETAELAKYDDPPSGFKILFGLCLTVYAIDLIIAAVYGKRSDTIDFSSDFTSGGDRNTPNVQVVSTASTHNFPLFACLVRILECVYNLIWFSTSYKYAYSYRMHPLRHAATALGDAILLAAVAQIAGMLNIILHVLHGLLVAMDAYCGYHAEKAYAYSRAADASRWFMLRGAMFMLRWGLVYYYFVGDVDNASGPAWGIVLSASVFELIQFISFWMVIWRTAWCYSRKVAEPITIILPVLKYTTVTFLIVFFMKTILNK